MASSTISSDLMVNMNEDIVFQILLWLPVVSLLRFKSVCKSWYSLIKSSRFISQQKNKGKYYNNDNNFIVLNPHPDIDISSNYGFPVYDLNFSVLSNFEATENLDMQCLQDKRGVTYGQMECCDGIVCLHHSSTWDMSLWNPATRQFRFLPESQLPSSFLDTYLMDFGFGFDFKTNDYKVVRIFTSADRKCSLAEVYSLNNDSWTCLDFVLSDPWVFSHPRAPYHNGTTYCWLGRKYIDYRTKEVLYEILSFDFTTQVFGTIPMPNAPSFDFNCFPNLTIFRENIACVNRVMGNITCVDYRGLETRDSIIEIWVLNEYGVKESWTRIYRVEPFDFTQGLGFSKSGDLLLFEDVHQLCLLHLFTHERKNLPITSCNAHEMKVAVYKESLLSVESRKECIPRSMRLQ